MTSGTFEYLPLSSIRVDRASRQRREVGDVSELSDSIRRLGLIHPIVVDRGHWLIAGERRLEAHRALGLDVIAVQWADEVDALTRKAIELEENVKRKDISWQEQSVTVKSYHDVMVAKEPDWTMKQTSDALGYSLQAVSELIGVGREIERGNTRVIEAPRFSTAKGIVVRERSRVAAEPLAAPTTDDLIINTDFIEWSASYAGPKFNFLHCDFPYGIEADSFNMGGAASHGGYADSFDYYKSLLNAFADGMERFCGPSAHAIFWFSPKHYTYTYERLTALAGWTWDEYPLIWHKTDNTGIVPRPHHSLRRIYETAFFGWRGDRRTVKAVGNTFGAPTERDIHMSVKPQPMLEHFFSAIVDANTAMLDPTAGSGSALRAALALGAGRVLGLEQNPTFATAANARLNQERK